MALHTTMGTPSSLLRACHDRPCMGAGNGPSVPDRFGNRQHRGRGLAAPGDLRAQLEETCRNLTALLSAAVGSGVARYQELRIYVAREADVEIATDLLHRTFPALSHLEAGVASLCREELLVEVEGLASIDV